MGNPLIWKCLCAKVLYGLRVINFIKSKGSDNMSSNLQWKNLITLAIGVVAINILDRILYIPVLSKMFSADNEPFAHQLFAAISLLILLIILFLQTMRSSPQGKVAFIQYAIICGICAGSIMSITLILKLFGIDIYQ